MRSLGQKIELLKVIAHPVRIKVLEELTKGVKCVSDFEDFLEIRYSKNYEKGITSKYSQ